MRELIDYRTKLIYSGIKPKIVITIFAKKTPKDERRRGELSFIFVFAVNQAIDSNYRCMMSRSLELAEYSCYQLQAKGSNPSKPKYKLTWAFI